MARRSRRYSRQAVKLAEAQADAIYEWEDGWRSWSRDDLTLAECRAVIRTACDKYKVKPPRVRQLPYEAGLSFSMPERGLIVVQAGSKRGWGGKNIATCLHEAAHHISYHVFGNRIDDHGPTFLGIFLWLLATAKVAPTSALHGSARAAGLRWRTIDPKKYHGE